MHITDKIGVALAMLATMSTARAQWTTGESLPQLRLPDIRLAEGLDPKTNAAKQARTVDLAMYRGQRLVLIEFASW